MEIKDGERGLEGDRGRVGELDGRRGELEEMTMEDLWIVTHY